MKRLDIYSDVKFTDFDAGNQDNATDWIDVRNSKIVTTYVTSSSELQGNHVFELQISPDKTDINDTDSSYNIIGLGTKTFDCTGFSYIRWKCKTPQSARIVNIWVIPFRDR